MTQCPACGYKDPVTLGKPMNLDMNVYQHPTTKEVAVFNDKDPVHTDSDGVQWILGSIQNGEFVKATISAAWTISKPTPVKPTPEPLPKLPIKQADFVKPFVAPQVPQQP